MARIAALLAALAAALLWAVLAVTPPAARGSDAPTTAFSAGRAMADVAAISRAPHPTGSAEDARVRAYLVGRLRQLGAVVSDQPIALGQESRDRIAQWSGRPVGPVVANNLIGIIPGTDGNLPALLLMAHHESVWGSPGSADDAIGIAAALEAARAITTQGRPRRDLILLFTDGEELGLDGSTAFFEQHALARRVGMIVNLEARGAGGRANMFETGADNGAQMRLYADRVARPATNSLSILIYDMMPNYTDYTVAKRHGIAGFNLAILGRAWAYHSPLATPAALDPRSLQDMGDQLLALAAPMAFAADLPARTPNAAFADLMGRITIAYPADAGWAILGVAALLIGAALRRARPIAWMVGGDALRTIALLVHGVLLLTVLNALSGAGGANYYDRLAALPRLEGVAALGIVMLMALLPWFRQPELRPIAAIPAMVLMWTGLLTGGPLVALIVMMVVATATAWFLPTTDGERGTGAILLLFVAAVVLQIFQPTIGPLLQWPLLLAAVAMAARAWLPATAALVIGAVCAAIGIGHLLAQAHFIFLGIGAEMPATMIVLLFAALPLIAPLWPDRALPAVACVALAVALVIALWVRFDPIAPSIPTYSLAEGGTKTRD